MKHGISQNNSETALLADTFLCRGMTKEEAEMALSAIHPRTSGFSPGETVIEGGTPFREIGLVCSGELAVVRRGEHRPVIHRVLKERELFGVSSLFGGGDSFPTTVIAREASTVLFLTEADVTALFAKDPRIAQNYIALLTEKIRFLNARLDTVAGRSAEERVAAHLLAQRAEDGTLGITKSALASLLGLGRASLYRILELFEEQGLIRAHRDRIEILDAKALENASNTKRS